jgi:hypothetical protein
MKSGGSLLSGAATACVRTYQNYINGEMGGPHFGRKHSGECDPSLQVSVIADWTSELEKFHDPACGSGSFLNCIFEKICDLKVRVVSGKATVYAAGCPVCALGSSRDIRQARCQPRNATTLTPSCFSTYLNIPLLQQRSIRGKSLREAL